MLGTFKTLRHSMQKSRSARLGGMSNAWRRWWATKRRGKLAMDAWIAWWRIHACEKVDNKVVTDGKRIREGVSNPHTPKHETGVRS